MYLCSCCFGRFGLAGARPGVGRRAFLAGGAAAGGVLVAEAATANPVTDLLGRMVSPEQERELGVKAFAQIKREVPLSKNRELQRRLNSVGERIVAASGATVPAADWEFAVFESDQINAFALPGGKVGFFEGIFRLMPEDAQLATVLGHEVGHVNARHHAERIGAETAAGLGTQVLGWALGLDPASGIDRVLAGVLGAGVQYGVLMPYSRGQELEADRLGLRYMAEAAFDPSAAVGFWQAMAQTGGAKPPAFLSTHPSDDQRIEAIRRELPPLEAIFERRRGGG